MEIKKYIAKIIENGSHDDMVKLSNMLDETILKLKVYDKECFKEYKKELIGMAYNYKFNEEMASEIVEKMCPLGEYWDLATTSSLKNDYGIVTDDYSFYIVMNSLANDYGSVIDKDDTDTYVKMANSFINDDDAVKDKVWKYFTTIPKED